MGGSDKNGALVQIIHGQGSRNPVIHLPVSFCVGGVARPLNGERGVGGKLTRRRRANRSRRRRHHYLAYSRQGRARALRESQGSRRCRRMACGQRAVAAPRQESTGSTGASRSPRARWRSSGCRCRSGRRAIRPLLRQLGAAMRCLGPHGGHCSSICCAGHFVPNQGAAMLPVSSRPATTDIMWSVARKSQEA